MRFSTASALGALALASGTAAQLVHCDGAVCFGIIVPPTTAARGSGDIFFQISGPTTNRWIGLGQGATMKDANLFMIYTDDDGDDVTLSPRLGVGETAPVHDLSTAQVELLDGSGVVNGIMTANVKCSNCQSWPGATMNFADQASKWIYAWEQGQPVNSDDEEFPLEFHTHYGEPTWNLTLAAGTASEDNSFPKSYAAIKATGVDPSTAAGGGGGNYPAGWDKVLIAHGVFGSLAFVLFFPLGAIGIRVLNLPGLVWIHAGWMVFSWATAICCMGMGIWLAVTDNYMSEYHSIIGIVVVSSLSIQPLSGMLHHVLYKSHGSPNQATYPHIWFGRAIVTLGVVNGGLGMKLAGTATGKKVAYAVGASIMYLTWFVVILLALSKSKAARSEKAGGQILNDDSEELKSVDNQGKATRSA